jgi:hypothetical protein
MLRWRSSERRTSGCGGNFGAELEREILKKATAYFAKESL